MIDPNRFKSAGKPTRAYRKWSSMLSRCYSPSHPAFCYYGARGIEVCDRWRGHVGFDNFLADMGEPPEGLTLERKDGTKGYSPENCRWATWQEQAANRRPGNHCRFGSLKDKARNAGLPYSVVYQRVKIHCWPEDKALSTPVLKRGRQQGQRKLDSDTRSLTLP